MTLAAAPILAFGPMMDPSTRAFSPIVAPSSTSDASTDAPGANIAAGASVTGLSVVGLGAAIEPGERLDGVRRPEPEG